MNARKMISLPADLAAQVEDYRFTQRMKTEADAIRRLIQLGLKAAGDRAQLEPEQKGASDPQPE